MTKDQTPSREEVIAWARESHLDVYGLGKNKDAFEHILNWFAALAYAAGAEAAIKPLTDEQITAGARALCNRMAEACGVNERDQWQLYADTFKEDAKAVLEAAAIRARKDNT